MSHLLSSGHGFDLIVCRFQWMGGVQHVSINWAKNSYGDIEANRILLNAPLVSFPRFRSVAQLFPSHW